MVLGMVNMFTIQQVYMKLRENRKPKEITPANVINGCVLPALDDDWIPKRFSSSPILDGFVMGNFEFREMNTNLRVQLDINGICFLRDEQGTPVHKYFKAIEKAHAEKEVYRHLMGYEPKQLEC